MKYTCPAPAKLNLFLQITGRRADGYHELQSVFQFIDLQDEITFRIRDDQRIVRATDWSDIPVENDLVMRAANVLAQRHEIPHGIDIDITKRIPMGAGLGGGSSDAATVLYALNRIWGLQLDTGQLAELGLSLGADVPVFIHGHAAWAEGVGEILTPVSPPEAWYLLVVPPIHVSTAAVFQHPALTRNSAPIRISDFLEGSAYNTLEPVVRQVYPEIDACISWLEQFGRPMLTGTGAGAFIAVDSEMTARDLAAKVPETWQPFTVKGMNRNPLLDSFEKFHNGV